MLQKLILNLKSSNFLVVLFCTLHLGAALSFSLTFQNNLIRLAFLLLCSISLVIALRRHAWLSDAKSISKINWDEKEKKWFLEQKNGEILEAKVQTSSVVTPYFAILGFRITNGGRDAIYRVSRSVLIFPDNVDKEEFRRLRVLLA
ncbi:MAG: protein YgfX [Gammaproteobacteria bacterium]